MTVNRSVSFVNVVLWSVSCALCVPSGKCSVSVHSTHFCCSVWKEFCFCAQNIFWCTVWKVFCFCAQYTFLMYNLESVLFLCTGHISYVPFEYRFFRAHTHFWCTVWKVFCFYAQYTFLMYHLESVLFLCTVNICDIPPGMCSFLCTLHISDAQCFDIYINDFSFRFCFARTASMWIYREEDSSNPCLTCNQGNLQCRMQSGMYYLD